MTTSVPGRLVLASCTDVAAPLGVAPQTIAGLCRKGLLDHYFVPNPGKGSRIYFDPRTLDATAARAARLLEREAAEGRA